MSLLIVQLTDLHIKCTNDPVFSRIENIVNTVASRRDQEVTAVHYIICGDITQSGDSEEFRAASQFLEKLVDATQLRMKDVSILKVLTPGNHDCSLSGDQSIRDMAISGVGEFVHKTPFEYNAVVRTILSPLQNYFDFARSQSSSISHDSENALFKSFSVEVDGHVVKYHLFNTAWMSTIGESAGSLYYPVTESSSGIVGGASISICVLHHPFNWFKQPQCMRPLRDRIEALADLVLSGHEHVGLLYGKEIYGATGVAYAEGAVLQERSDFKSSGFHILRVDFDHSKITFYSFEWTGESDGHYENRMEPATRGWDAAARRSEKRKLSSSFAKVLDDSGLPIRHRVRGNLALSDYFIFPDLASLDSELRVSGVRVRGNRVVQVIEENKRVVLVAPDKSGRTSLAKRLFAELHSQGYAPLLLNGSHLPKSGKFETLLSRLHSQVSEQYEAISGDEYDQIPIEKRVVIIDDLQKYAGDRMARERSLADIEPRFGIVVVITSEQMCIDELFDSDGSTSRSVSVLDSFALYLMLPFGHGRCEDFIRQWVSLGDPDESMNLDERVEEISRQLSDVLRTAAVPPYPWIILVLVQLADSPDAPMASSGSYSHLLNSVITTAISRPRKCRLSVSGIYSYLGAFARTTFALGTLGLNEADATKFHHEYFSELGVPGIEFSTIVSDLEAAGILERLNGEIVFRHNYTFCFFVAQDLANRLSSSDAAAVKATEALAANLYREDDANIMVFLANQTQNPIVVDAILRTSSSLFVDCPEANLESDVDEVNQLATTVRSLVAPGTDALRNRKLLLDKQDDVAVRQIDVKGAKARKEVRIDSVSSSSDGVYTNAMQVSSGFRVIEILGQVLKNGAAVRPVAEKTRIADAVFRLAKRIMGFVLRSAPQTVPNLIRRLEELYRGKLPGSSDEDVVEDVSDHVFNLYAFAVFAIVKYVAGAVSDRDLEETFRRTLGPTRTLANQLVEIAIQLDRPTPLLPIEPMRGLCIAAPKNAIVLSVVRSLAVDYLYLHRVRDRERQRWCEALEIKTDKRVYDKSQKLLSEG